MTHTYFGLDVLKKLPRSCSVKLENSLEYYKLFCQGSDPFMFSHFLLGKKAREIGSIQNKMHKTKTRAFFISIVQYIHKNHLMNDSDVMAYLYGYICHYCLDYHTHPFITYKSGVFKSDDKTTDKYNGIHQEIEYMIDWYLIQKREKIIPKKFKVYQEIFKFSGFTPNLEHCIEESIGKTYQVKDIVDTYRKSIFYMKHFFRLANYDPFGWKQKVYKFIDLVSSRRMIHVKELSFYNSYEDKLDYLNLERKKWNFPWDKSQTFTTSFLDLYEMAINEAIRIIEGVTNELKNETLNQDILNKLFLNLSFSTGQCCNKKLVAKYFEF